MNSRGFTLIEILMVIACIGIISSIIIFNVMSSTEDARITKARAYDASIPSSLPNNIVSEWKFDGQTPIGSNASAGNVLDTWGVNNGTIIAGKVPIVSGGSDCVLGKCLKFNGTSYIQITDSNNSLDFQKNFTISVWYKATSLTGTRQTIFSKTNASEPGSPAYSMDIYNNNGFSLRFFGYDSVAYGFIVGNEISAADTKWHHIVITYDGLKFKSYFDAKTYKTVTNSTEHLFRNDTNLFLIGTRVNADSGFIGYLDDIRIYDAVLTFSQIQDEYYTGIDNMYKSGGLGKKDYSAKKKEFFVMK